MSINAVSTFSHGPINGYALFVRIENAKWGYSNQKGNAVLTKEAYSFARNYSNQRAIVKKGK